MWSTLRAISSNRSLLGSTEVMVWTPVGLLKVLAAGFRPYGQVSSSKGAMITSFNTISAGAHAIHAMNAATSFGDRDLAAGSADLSVESRSCLDQALMLWP